MKEKLISRKDYIPFSVMKREAMRDPEFRKVYDELEPEFVLRRAVLDARIKKGMTQKDIAQNAGTTQSAIARFEAGGSNPTLAFMQKLSKAVGARLEVRLVSPRR